MRRFLYHQSLCFHLALSVGLGTLFRALCAYYVFGPQALDDFNHAITPAYQWLEGQPLNLPGYRSHLLIWLLGGLMNVARKFGYDTPLGELRACYLGLGLLSLTGVLGTYLMVRDSRSRLFAATALYLTTLFPLMPFLSTRTFGESVATGFVTLGFGRLESLRVRGSRDSISHMFGFLALGVATLFRFQVGLLFVVYGLIAIRKVGRPALIGGLLAGLITLILAGKIDSLSGKSWLETLGLYLRENSTGAREFGVQPWYATWLLFLGLGLFPFSLIFWHSLLPFFKRHWTWVVPILVFVAVHSAIPHKEERFLYPIVGLELWAIAWLWSRHARSKIARVWFTPLMLFTMGPVLILICTVNSQEGSIAPQAAVSSHYREATILYYRAQDGLFHFKDYFVRPPLHSQLVTTDSLGSREIDQAMEASPTQGAVVVVTSDSEKLHELGNLEGQTTHLSQCLKIIRSSSWSDQLLYSLNPHHNQRRRPTWYLVCERRERRYQVPFAEAARQLGRNPTY